MKKSKIKELLKQESDNLDIPMSNLVLSTPIQEKSPYETKEHSKFSFFKFATVGALSLILFVLAFTLFMPISNEEGSSNLTSYVLAINPAFCITTNASDEIVAVSSMNDDADSVLATLNFDNIEGKSLDNCLQLIIQTVKQQGFFDNYNNNISVFAVNNSEVKAQEKGGKFKTLLKKHLSNNDLTNINIDKGVMSISDFKNKMGFENNYNDLDKMQNDIRNHNRYFNPNNQPSMLPPNQ